MIDPGAQPQRRLQRPADFTGQPLNSFRSVVFRHGLPVAVVAVLSLVLLLLGAPAPVYGIEPALSDPARYALAGVVIFICLTGYGSFVNRGLSTAVIFWVIYLGLLSLWEEWVFRVVAPHYLQLLDLDVRTSVVIANVVFGALHYFTLRWKWQWCVLACVGGMALSRQFQFHEDLLWLVALHWVATFINTPKMPESRPVEPDDIQR